MIHYTCDRCRKVIETERETRYRLKIEIQATLQDEMEVDEREQLLAIEDMINQLDEDEGEQVSPELFSRRTFDLCPRCYAIYLQNPLAIEAQPHLGFSDN